ncbi:MAG: hypothetical protein EXQ92_05430 [Alphaproteobacteria bacterium]|nr:hypothetical protein [Alphaproteobacteria bacterium]
MRWSRLMTSADAGEPVDLRPLLEPIALGRVTIRNRMVSTAHNSRYGEDGLPGKRHQRYSEERAPWRQELMGIVAWRQDQIARLGVDLRLNCRATPERILAEAPDVVILATGGQPHKGAFAGVEHTLSTSEVLTRNVPGGARVLVYDDHGGAQASSAAEYLAQGGASVRLVSPDRSLGEEMGPNNWAVFKQHLYRLGVAIEVDHRLDAVTPAANRLRARIVNEYTEESRDEDFDMVVAEHGTRPDEALYADLTPHSGNGGRIDCVALKGNLPQPSGSDSGFALYRVGDAVASRDIHAAIYDSVRLCHVL